MTDTSVELTWEPAYSKEPVKSYQLIYKAPELNVQVTTVKALIFDEISRDLNDILSLLYVLTTKH